MCPPCASATQGHQPTNDSKQPLTLLGHLSSKATDYTSFVIFCNTKVTYLDKLTYIKLGHLNAHYFYG